METHSWLQHRYSLFLNCYKLKIKDRLLGSSFVDTMFYDPDLKLSTLHISDKPIDID